MAALSRARRVGAEHVFELARHLTERDRKVALCLYDQQLLTTDQLRLLFFSSKRRAQDRLLFLYRQRVLDRFYPAVIRGAGKPQAHWLLDEAGAHLVAASLDLDRKQLPWQRRDDWRSHPQLAHRLEVNRFVTDLIAATLPDRTLGIGAWFGSREAAARMGERMRGTLRPDAELVLVSPAGPVDLLLEWDRGTEILERLEEKLRRYRTAERKLYDYPGPRSILFVVPGARRLRGLHELAAKVDRDGWPILATTAAELRRAGPLAPIWQRLDTDQPPCSLTALPPRRNLGGSVLDPANALGRRWRHDNPGFWDRLSPLSRAAAEPREVEEVDERHSDSAQPCRADVARGAGPATDTNRPEMRHPAGDEGSLARRRAELEEELGADIAEARARRDGTAGADLRPSGIDGYMDDPEPDEERSWQ
ncbi:MAG: replication-relaxation family protein [Gaiellaceae bacterium]